MDHGRQFEHDFAEIIGGSVVPGSGSGKWAKMDVRGVSILWSCKHADARQRAVKLDEFYEVERAVRGPGGVGGDTLPGMAIGLGSEAFVLMRADEFRDLVQNRVPPTVVVRDQAEARRMLASETPLQRRMREEGS